MDTERHGDRVRIGLTFNEVEIASIPRYSGLVRKDFFRLAREQYDEKIRLAGIHPSQSEERVWLEVDTAGGYALASVLASTFTEFVTDRGGPIRSVLDATPRYDPASLEYRRALLRMNRGSYWT